MASYLGRSSSVTAAEAIEMKLIALKIFIFVFLFCELTDFDDLQLTKAPYKVS